MYGALKLAIDDMNVIRAAPIRTGASMGSTARRSVMIREAPRLWAASSTA